MKFPTKPAKGQKALQSIYNTVCQICDYLPSLNVVGDNKTTYVNHSSFGTTIHAVQPHTILRGENGQTYYAGSGIAITSGNIINALLSAGPNIRIDYNSGYFVISGTPAGSGQIPPAPVIVTSSGLGYPDYSNLYNDDNSVSGIGISFVLPVASGQNIRFYTDAQYGSAWGRFAPQEGEAGTAFFMQNNEDYTTDCNGWVRISVFDNGLDEGKCLRFYVNGVDGSQALPLYRFHGFTEYEAGYGIALESGVFRNMLYAGSGLMSTAHYDPNSNPYNPTLTGITFDLSAHFYNDLVSLSGRHNFGGGVILSSSNGELVWAQNITKVSQLTNDAGYITRANEYNADNDTLSTINNGNTFYARDIQKLLSGYGGTYVGHLSTDEAGHEITLISSTNVPLSTSQLQNDSGFITEADIPTPCTYLAGSGLALSTDNQTFYLTANIPTSTSQLYNDVPFLTSSNVYEGNGIDIVEYEDGIKIINTITGLNQLDNGTTNYITKADIPPSTTYIGTSGIAIETILDENQQPTTSANIYISADFYNTLTNPTNNRILSCSNGSLTWAENTGGSSPSPTPTPGGDLTTVYIKTQGYLTAVPNTRYVVMPAADLSTNIVDYPYIDPTALSSFEYQCRIYKYFIHGFGGQGYNGRPDILLTTLLSTVEGYQKYGALYNQSDPTSWADYEPGQGTIFIFEPQQQDCYIEIDCSLFGDSIAMAPNGTIIWSTTDNTRVSGTPDSWYDAYLHDSYPTEIRLSNWGYGMYQSSKHVFVYDHTTNMWYATQV